MSIARNNPPEVASPPPAKKRHRQAAAQAVQLTAEAKPVTQYARLLLTLGVVIRECRKADLPALEWYGVFRQHRRLIRSTFAQQQRGKALILVAEANGVPSGQIWLDLCSPAGDPVGFLWALRVFPALQGLGLGTRLIHAAEQALCARGLEWAEMSVEPENLRARQLYHRLGYEQLHPTPTEHPRAAAGQLVFRKRL